MPLPIHMAGLSDLAGQLRGKGFAAADLEARCRSGVGWTPTNAQITCFDGIAPSPYGSTGDMLLRPDPKRSFTAPMPAGPDLRLTLGHVTARDGSPWMACLSQHLSAALARFEAASGLHVMASFEHEFILPDHAGDSGFSLAGFHRAQGALEDMLWALHGAGLRPDSLLREYGPGQFEVTLPPQPALRAADEAIALREIIRAVARARGETASFTPCPDPDTVGNGVHIHLSFWDAEGHPATFDPEGPCELSRIAGQAAAGIVAHMPAICALTAPSVPSYTRLQPHRWSASFANLAVQDREAGLRICPTSSDAPDKRARQFNYEFRATDAAASPWLALSALVHAAAAGVEAGLPCPEPTEGDLSEMSPEALAELGVRALPRSLPEALDLLETAPEVAGWYPEGFIALYLDHKRFEASEVADLPEAEMLKRYAAAY